MFFAKAVLIATLALSANAAFTPHIARNPHHRVLVARSPAPEPVAQPVMVTPRRRAVQRCKPRSSTAVLSSTAAPSTSPSATPSATPSVAPVNVAPAPPKVSSTAATPSSTQVAQPTKETPSSSQPPKETPSSSQPPKETPSSSESPKETPTSTQPPAETPTETPKATPSSTQPPKETPSPTKQSSPSPSPTANSASGSSGSSSGSTSGTYTGDGTFYGTGLGACGTTNKDTDFIAAIAHADFDSFPGYTDGNPNHNPICNKQVTAHYQGNSVTVAITDRCGGCAPGALDFSPTAFSQLADQGVGRIHGMTWSFD